MAIEPRNKPVKEILAEHLTDLIDRNPSLAALILLSVFVLVWSIQDFLTPAFKFVFLELVPRIGGNVVEWLTRSILFLLVNLVIVAILISSGSISWTSIKKELQKELPESPIGIKTDSVTSRPFAQHVRSVSFSPSGSTNQISPLANRSMSMSKFPAAKQRGSILVPSEATPKTQDERSLETCVQPSSSFAHQNYKRRPQVFAFAGTDMLFPGSILDAKHSILTEGSHDLQNKLSERFDGAFRNAYSDYEEPSRSSCEYDGSTRKSFRTSETDTSLGESVQRSAVTSSSAEITSGEAPSSVIVRNVSVNAAENESSLQSGLRDPLVIGLDELNERIEALYAKHREQARQDSLRRN